MKIHEFVWSEDRVEHIARHGVHPEEVEEVCFGRALVQRTKSSGANPVSYVLGQTAAGRYVFCVVIQFPDGKGFPVTARPMTRKEQRRFNQWQKPMKTPKIPSTDSIQELARFWDTHDLTDFEDELEEVSESIFEHRAEETVSIRLLAAEVEVVKRLAKVKGMGHTALIREWVLEKLHHA